jgi:formamidopyrimidine-DNA glycosylase
MRSCLVVSGLKVYDRAGETCKTPGCGGIVKRFTQNGRSTFWCPKCQK